MGRFCGARVKQGDGYCRKWPVPGRTRCRLHGGLSAGARIYRARDVSAAVAGRRRWLERKRAEKAAGLIAKIPCGRIPGRRSWEPIEVSRARAWVSDQIRAVIMDQIKDPESGPDAGR